MGTHKKTKLPLFCSDRKERDFWERHSIEEFAEELDDLEVVIRPARHKRAGARKTVSSLRQALPFLSLKEETLEYIESQVKNRRRHPARTPRL
ncbi:MAG TPA: hypothetical protein VGX03_03940 [Candidatus Binatia bacterium]|jgi:hypothetical protein|nr:hypothetical protein [Candidatus Binatia bacterium]